MRKKILTSASMMCADFKNLERTIKSLEKAGIDTLHFDFCDGHFAPPLLFSPIIIKSLRNITSMRFDAHMYCEYPSRYLEDLYYSGIDLVVIQYESKEDFDKVISKVIKIGMKAGLGILPESKVPRDVYKVFSDISQAFDSRGLKNMEELSNLVLNNNCEIDVGADGHVGISLLPKFFNSGANFLILGTTSIFNNKNSPSKELKKLKGAINNYFIKHI